VKKMLRKKGFTLVEIMIVVAIIGLLAAIAIPNFMGARTSARTQACIANLKQIQGAIQIYALDNNLSDTATAPTAAALAATGGYLKKEPICPSGTTSYATTTVSADPTCPNVAVSGCDKHHL
jgi:type II secretion system protein G